MIVTKTVKSVDWYFHGALANEKTSWVGTGLYSGFIYFKHGYSALPDYEEVVRENYFIDLSDGTTYPLGDGAVASKMTVVNHGIQPDGSTCVEVTGLPSVGVGVVSIWRNITFTYEDGRTPILDTDQLKGILAELHDSLTASMVETAEAVKQEVKDACDASVAAAKAELTSLVSTTKTEVMESATQAIDTAKSTLKEEVNQNILIASFNIGPRNVAFNSTSFLIDSTTSVAFRPAGISYSAGRNAILLRRKNMPRTVKVTLTGNFTNYAACIFGIKDSNGNIIAQTVDWEQFDRANKAISVTYYLAADDGDQTSMLGLGRPFIDSGVNTTPELRVENAKLTIEVFAGSRT